MFQFSYRFAYYPLSSLKLHTGNNGCMLNASVIAIERAFSCSTMWRRSLWIIRETDNRWIPATAEISLTVRWFCLPDLAPATQLLSVFYCVCRCPYIRLSTVPNFNSTGSVLMPFFVQHFSRNFVIHSFIHFNSVSKAHKQQTEAMT